MNKLFVGNLSFDVNEGTLEAFIRECGIEVEKVDIIRDTYTGKSRGFGFVELPEAQNLDDAISTLNEKNLEGRTLNVNRARERSSSRSPYRGGGRGQDRY